MSQAPDTFDQFMASLQEYGITDFDESLGHQLRLHASSRFFGTIMTCGKTCHCQDQTAFTKDITEHRIDILLLTEDALPIFDDWINLLSETGLIILIASDDIRRTKMQSYQDKYFCMDNGHLFMYFL